MGQRARPIGRRDILKRGAKQHGARVWIDDLENDLSHERTYTYLAPQSLPIGLRLIGWDGSEDADLSGMPDEEMEELALLQRAVASYKVIAEDVSISSLFPQYAATDETIPFPSSFCRRRVLITTGGRSLSRSQSYSALQCSSSWSRPRMQSMDSRISCLSTSKRSLELSTQDRAVTVSESVSWASCTMRWP